jgi:CBS domain-containing protein
MDIMKTDVEACWVMEPAADVAARMRARGVGFLPVCNDTGEVVGTITDRDLTVRLLAQRLPYGTPIHRVMSTNPVTCSPYDDLELAEDIIRRYHNRRIICVDDRLRPVGIISRTDVAEAGAGYGWRPGRLLRESALRDTPRYAD